jgi:hypothetical protein
MICREQDDLLHSKVEVLTPQAMRHLQRRQKAALVRGSLSGGWQPEIASSPFLVPIQPPQPRRTTGPTTGTDHEQSHCGIRAWMRPRAISMFLARTNSLRSLSTPLPTPPTRTAATAASTACSSCCVCVVPDRRRPLWNNTSKGQSCS